MRAGGRRGAAAPCYLNEVKVKVEVVVEVVVVDSSNNMIKR
jgi:hypothetical protein